MGGSECAPKPTQIRSGGQVRSEPPILTRARFSDKPERRAGSLQTGVFATGAGFYSGADWLGQPNAVLTGQTARGAPVTVVVTLYSPAYNTESATLTYKVHTPSLVLFTITSHHLAGAHLRI